MHGLTRMLEHALHSRNGLVRKCSALALRAPKQWAVFRSRAEDLRLTPAVMVNSFPKSGTHLLDQVASGFPNRVNYGTFIASLTSSFQMRPRSIDETLRLLRRIVPGELVRAHLFYNPRYAETLRHRNVVHFYIYRDPRDVVLSGCHYLTRMNRWHRWRKHFRDCKTLEDAILTSTRGVYDESGATLMPNVAERFAPYEMWLSHPEVCALRFEELRGPGLSDALGRMLDFYATRSETPLDRNATLDRIRAALVPERSHTFRKGSGGAWREAFTPACKDAFKDVAGDLLVRLGYERSDDW